MLFIIVDKGGNGGGGGVIFFFIVTDPPTDGKRLKDFYHNFPNSALQHLVTKLWKITDTLSRISSMTDSFKYTPPTVEDRNLKTF